MCRVQLSDNVEEVRVGINKIEIPEDLVLQVDILYKQGYIEKDGDKAKLDGFRLIAVDGNNGYIKFEEKDGSRRVEIKNVFIDRVWHPGTNLWTKLKVKITPKDIWKIDDLLGTGDLLLSWSLEGYVYLTEPNMEELNIFYPVPIFIRTAKPYEISRKTFVKDVLEPAGRFKREFIEISWVEPIKISELLAKAPDQKLKEFITIIMERYQQFLIPAIEKFSEASEPSDYRDVITDVRRFFSAAKEIYSKEYKEVIKKLYLDTRTFEGDGADDEASKESDAILRIMLQIKSMASGLGVHPETSEKTAPKTFIHYPQKEDAKYLLFTSMLIVDYMMRKIERMIRLKG